MSKKDDAFKALFPRLTGYARYLCKDASLADELVAQTMLTAAEKLSESLDIRNLNNWCQTVLRNKYMDHLRKKRESQLSENAPEDQNLESSNPSDDPFSRILFSDCMAQLEGKLKDVLLQNLVEGETTASIAERLAKPQNTILTWLAKAKLQFHDCVMGSA